MAKTDEFRNRASASEAADDLPRSPQEGEMIGDVILKRYSRREMMGGTLGVVAVASLFGPSLLSSSKAAAGCRVCRGSQKALALHRLHSYMQRPGGHGCRGRQWKA